MTHPILRPRHVMIWGLLALVMGVPIVGAMNSPQLAWRSPVYIAAGFAGIVAMALLLLQPVLIGGHLPGLAGRTARRLHRICGTALVLAVTVHIAALWVTSPPDVVDALLLRSPTPFSVWGVLATVGVLVTVVSVTLRRRLRLHPYVWAAMHTGIAAIIAMSTVLHAWLIEGTMHPVSKTMLCIATLGAVAGMCARTWRKALQTLGNKP